MEQQNIVNRLDRIEKALKYIQENMIDVDVIITEEERKMLDESVENEKSENLVSLEKIKNVLNIKFEEKLPLARKSLKLPLVLGKEEVIKIINSTSNLKHKLVIMFLYYARLRLDEVRNISWLNIDINR